VTRPLPGVPFDQSSPVGDIVPDGKSPSISNPPRILLPDVFAARAADVTTAKLKYCNSSESTKSADHDRARLRRVRALMKCHSPRDAMSDSLRSPR